jgi:hypothetical protein
VIRAVLAGADVAGVAANIGAHRSTEWKPILDLCHVTLIDIVNLAVKTVGAARIAGRLLGRETPELDELHSALAPARRRRLLDSALHDDSPQQPADDDSEDGDDATDAPDVSGPAVDENTDIDGDGLLGAVVDAAHWIVDKVDQMFESSAT